MSQGDELRALYEHVYSRLSGDATLAALVGTRIYPGVNPTDEWPCVILDTLPRPDAAGPGGARILTRAIARVRVIMRGHDDSDAFSAVARVDQLLHGVSGYAISGTHYVSTHRSQTIDFSTTDAGQLYRHMGGEYLVDVHPL